MSQFELSKHYAGLNDTWPEDAGSHQEKMEDAGSHQEKMKDARARLAELKEEIRRLKEEVSQLILEKEELEHVICPKILADYYARFGKLEYAVSEAECEFLRLKRLMEMVQARKNRQEEVNLAGILEDLSREFARYQEELEKLLRRMEQLQKERSAADFGAEDSSKEAEGEAEEAAEAKKIYRELVKRLHPDMNPNQGEREAKLFQKVVEAYGKGDVAALRLLYSQVEEVNTDAESGSLEEQMAVEAQLKSQRDFLQRQVEILREAITRIKQTKPYVLRDYLENSAKGEARQQELEKALQAYEEGIRGYRDQLREEGVWE